MPADHPPKYGNTGSMVVRPLYQRGAAQPSHLVVTVCGKFDWEAQAFFSSNGFPDPKSHGYVEAAARQLSLMSYSAALVRSEVETSRQPFLENLKHDKTIGQLRSYSHTIFLENLSYQVGLFSCLVALKAGLDVLAKLTTTIIEPGSRPIDGFNRGKLDGADVYGGKLIAWLDKRQHLVEPVLANELRRHVTDWIGAAIKYRDEFVHFGTLRSARGSSLVLSKDVDQLTVDDVIPPAMPHGQPVADYCEGLVENYKRLLKPYLNALPGVLWEYLPGVVSPERVRELRDALEAARSRG